MDPRFRIIIAIDDLGIEQTLHLASAIGDQVEAFKIHALYDRHGPGVVKQLKKAGVRRVWVDAKLHDKPSVVYQRAADIAVSGADIVSVHASGGTKMMQAAVGARIEVYAITILASLGENDVLSLYGRPAATVVLGLTQLAFESGVTGIVCSPKEIEYVARHKSQLALVADEPTDRLDGTGTEYRQQAGTLATALKAGADYLVVGHRITSAPDPSAALDELEREIYGEQAKG